MIDELQGLSEGPEQRVGPAKPSDICEKRGGGGGGGIYRFMTARELFRVSLRSWISDQLSPRFVGHYLDHHGLIS